MCEERECWSWVGVMGGLITVVGMEVVGRVMFLVSAGEGEGKGLGLW